MTLDEKSINHSAPRDSGNATWFAIIALNGVSALAQIGQLGIAFVLFPLSLELHHVPAWKIGIVSSGLWAGTLIGLVAAPHAIRRMGYSNTVCLGLLASIVALLLAPCVRQSYWVLGSLVTGIGYGLRWIGNETWLFGIVPARAQGRIVGFHESLLAIAAIAGPALVALLGADGFPSFVTAAAFTAAAALPLLFANLHSAPPAMEARPSTLLSAVAASIAGIVRTGPLTASIGGVIESALVSMFPIFASERGIDAVNIAWLLSIFGLGAMLLQLPIGWLADRRGVRVTSMIVAALTALSALTIEVVAPLGMMLGVLMFVLGGGHYRIPNARHRRSDQASCPRPARSRNEHGVHRVYEHLCRWPVGGRRSVLSIWRHIVVGAHWSVSWSVIAIFGAALVTSSPLEIPSNPTGAIGI
jgi:MFS family permease